MTEFKELTVTEIDSILNHYDNAEFKEFRIGDLFENIDRGSRLKSSERIQGVLPFITAGVNHTGISAYISNDVTIYPNYSLTIDMFGNTYYRNFEFGADDHVTILWSDEIKSENVLLYMQPIIQKTIMGKFSYSRNFFPKNAYDLKIPLPVFDSGDLDYKLMENYIKVIKQKYIDNQQAYYQKRIEIARSLV